MALPGIQAADSIYLGGTVITLDPAQPHVEAVALANGRILLAGSVAAAQALAGEGTRTIDLRGRTLIPGLIEPHNHFSSAGTLMLGMADLQSPPVGAVTCIDDLLNALRERAAAAPPGGWVQGFGYDDTLLAEQRHPTRADLDRVSTRHPIFISHVSGHLAAVNTPALELAGINRDTPQPEGGQIRLDPLSGEPDGVLAERGGIWPVLMHRPATTAEEQVRGVAFAAQRLLAVGVTSAVDAGIDSARTLIAVQQARARGLLPVRASLMLRQSLAYGEHGERMGFVTGFGDDRLKLSAFKITADGSIQGYTGWLGQPYHVPYRGDTAYRGLPVIAPEQLKPMVLDLHRAGFQIATHANGDAAIDAIIEAIREAQTAEPRPDVRHRIEHCQLVREDQLDAMAELGITPSFFVAHVYYWGDRHRDIFMGPERARRISPLASALRRGIRFSLHSDWPVTPVAPLFSIWAAVNRITRNGAVLGEEFCITPEQALRAMTLDAAWQDHEDERKGSIETGKLADFTILEENPLTVAPERIKDIAVSEVIVGGESVYRAEATTRR